VYAEVAGIGITSDAYHMAAPDPVGAGACRAMTMAIKEAGVTPSDICHINAHATSTPVGDLAEAEAIRGTLGDATDGVLVSATKSMTGHLLGAAGAVESIMTILALRDRLAPATINVDDPDDDIALNVVTGSPRPLPEGTLVALNNSFGFGGHNVALAIRGVE
jgi:3-oxoacyl-[acyl-carrier-protein] synthase II